MLKVSQLYIYPVKSLGGIAIEHSLVTDRGLQYDRRYMLVDDQGRFLTQREFPLMALLQTSINDNILTVSDKNSIDLKLELPLVPATHTDTIKVQVWDDACDAILIDPSADKWFTDRLGFSCRLVYMPESTKRYVDTSYAVDHDITSFSDAYPVLMIGQSSLNDLNGRLNEPLPMNRFRPNIVFTGGSPFEEDCMEQFSINGIIFYGVKPCARCVVTTTNQETAVVGKEPLTTLAKYRLLNNKVLFGQNVLCSSTGIINTGDTIELIKTKQAIII